MHPFPHTYLVSSSATPEGDIVLDSPGIPALPTITPPEFDGPGGLWSPETLLVASVVDCFLLTFRGIARASKMPWTRISAECIGTLERPERVSQFTGFAIRAHLVLPEGVSEDQARRIATRAEETCLITQSLKGHTTIEIEISRS
jgi:organic hydroperoxide reductase OsmC/OhrA